MAFYVGKYIIDQDSLEPRHTGVWTMPDAPTQHMAETSNVEELHVLPTDMDSVPTQIQFGACTWSDDEGFAPDHDAFDQFYVTDEKFYVRNFAAGESLYSQFYVRGEAFYVRSWTSGSALYDTFYVREENFYVRGWTSASDLYSQFYVKTQEFFYVQNWTPVDFFYPFSVEDC